MPAHTRVRSLLSAPAAGFAQPTAEPHYGPDLHLEPVHRDIALRFDLEVGRADAVVTTTFRAREDGVQQIVLNAVDLLELSVEAADEHAVGSRYDGETLRLRWDAPLSRGDERRVRMSYHLQGPVTGMTFRRPSEAWPERVFLAYTDNETERARYWLPCLDHPAARTKLDLHLRVADEYRALGNGALAGTEAHEDGTTTYHWHLDQPCPSYLICVAAGELRQHSAGVWRGRPVAYYSTTNYSDEVLARSFGPTLQMLDYLSERLGLEFPYPKYAQLALPDVGGAMENISLVTWDEFFLMDEALHAEWGWVLDLVNLHEMSHSWFGDAVVCRDFAHVWLKEGWATYMESVWLGDTEGEDALQWQLHEEERNYRAESDERYARPIVTRHMDTSWTMFDHHLYPGAAWRIHMLRRTLGDDVFWPAVQRYLQRFNGQVVETDDFRRALEEESGRHLSRFFDEWLRSPGYPKLKVTSAWKDGQLELVVEQQQIDKDKGIGTFTFELQVDLEVDGAWRRETLAIGGPRKGVTFGLDSEPTQIVIDPDCSLIHALEFQPGDDQLKRSLREAPTLRGRIQAARSLGVGAKASSVDALREAFDAEPHGGVRAEIARALAKAGTQRAIEALAEVIEAEREPRWLAEIVKLAGEYRDAALRATLLRLLDREDLGHWARAAALTALGAQRDAADLPLLQRMAEQDTSWFGHVRRGAAAGLGHQRTDAARQVLLGRVAHGADSTRVRAQAAESLAEAASWCERPQREQTVDALIDLTRDPEYGVRMAAARALAALKDPRAAGALKALEKRVAGQDLPRVRGAARALVASKNPDQALRKEVDELKEQLRKLAAQVEKIEGA